MSRSIRPSYAQSGTRSANGRRSLSLPFVQIVREYGVRGLIALMASAVIAFAPFGLLAWFNLFRYQPVIRLAPGQSVQVKSARDDRDQQQDEPGETALLQVICEVPTLDGWQVLRRDDDPARYRSQLSDSIFVRRELVYLRPAGDALLPFGLLGNPPLSAWVPAGEYEILVVHEARQSDEGFGFGAKSANYPLAAVFDTCTLEEHQTNVCRIRLPHYDWGCGEPLALASGGDLPREQELSDSESRAFAAAIEQAVAIPSPSGYVLTLPEPQTRHSDDHRGCVLDFAELRFIPREWNRDQIASVRNWLPQGAEKARNRLSSLVDALQWREHLEGWYTYAAAGIAGLVLTKWGAMAMLNPNQRRKSFADSVKLLTSIFVIAMVIWFVFSVLTDGPGCRGLVPLR